MKQNLTLEALRDLLDQVCQGMLPNDRPTLLNELRRLAGGM